MSNIINNKSDLIELRNSLNKIRNKEINEESLEVILLNLLPRKDNKDLVDYKISKNRITTTAKYYPQYNTIELNPININKWLNRNTNDFIKYTPHTKEKILKSYLLLFIISHEIEHSYQHLISNKIIDKPSIITEGYKNIFDLFNKDNSIIPNPYKNLRRELSLYLYKIHENDYIVERNANIECSDFISRFALINSQNEISELFNDIKSLYLRLGYKNDNKGSLEETYKKILMYDKYKKFNKDTNLTEDEKANFGLNINEDTREKILNKKLKIFK